MTEKPKDVEKYFENSKCKICGIVVQPHFQGNKLKMTRTSQRKK